MKTTHRILTIAGLSACVLTLIGTGCKKKDKDTEKPVITVTGGTSVESSLNSIYSDMGATATDSQDGNITSKITTSGVSSVNKDSTGVYTITYSVSDEAGNSASATRTVRVKNDAEVLLGAYNVRTTSPYPSASNTDYVDTISISKTVNDKIWVTMFAARAGGKAYMTLPTDSTISVPTQVVSCESPPTNHTFENAAAGSAIAADSTSTVITVNYKETKGTTSTIARSVYTKQ